MAWDDKLSAIIEKYEALAQQMSDPAVLSNEQFAQISKEYSDLGPVVEKIQAYQSAKQARLDAQELLEDQDVDDEMRLLAEEECTTLEASLSSFEQEIKIMLLPRDKADEKNAILEVRAGTGGDEAALFAAELFRMYQRYAESNRWHFEILSLSEIGIGGYKEASAVIAGKGVFARMKFESGVHRVQRVPETESGGRIHTSAATVAVLPEAEEVDIAIDEKDLRIDIFRASGPGGQSVNTTDSAVRITHVPSGIVVSQQDEKSQHKNKAKAMKVLRSRLFDLEREKQAAERSANRKSQVGSGDRSERIRTYNFPQGRVTDHRINLTLYKIEEIIQHDQLDEVVNALIQEDQAIKLAEMQEHHL